MGAREKGRGRAQSSGRRRFARSKREARGPPFLPRLGLLPPPGQGQMSQSGAERGGVGVGMGRDPPRWAREREGRAAHPLTLRNEEREGPDPLDLVSARRGHIQTPAQIDPAVTKQASSTLSIFQSTRTAPSHPHPFLSLHPLLFTAAPARTPAPARASVETQNPLPRVGQTSSTPAPPGDFPPWQQQPTCLA